MNSIGRLVFSFEEDEIRSRFLEFQTEATRFVNESTKHFNDVFSEELIESLVNTYPPLDCAGKFQRVLKDKLISIQDT